MIKNKGLSNESGQALMEAVLWSCVIALTLFAFASAYRREYVRYREVVERARSPIR